MPANMIASKVATFLDNTAHGEDNFLVRELGNNVFLDGVMDGVTGHGGEDASQAVVEALSQADIKSGDDIVKTLEEVNDELFLAGGGRFLMTTASVALFTEGKLHVVSIGDSPVFLVRKDSFKQLSGRIGGFLHVGVAKAVGAAEKLEFHRAEVDIEPGDRLALATDGVTDNMSPEELVEIVRQAATPEEAASKINTIIGERLATGHPVAQFGSRFRHDDRTAIFRFFAEG